MRTITGAQATVYASSLSARSGWSKVEVFSTLSSSWIDITSYLGYNWIKSVEIDESIDNSIATATVECFLIAGPQGEITSSPFYVTSSKLFEANLLKPYKQIRISLAVMPEDVTPSTSDYMLKFRGRIQTISVTQSGITLRCRDEMGDLADAFIEADRQYGSNVSSVQVETVIQSILNDWGSSVVLWSPNGSGGTPFNAGDSPGWAIKQYNQQRQTVMDALKVLVDQVAYDIRFRWQSSAADLKLVMMTPNRSSPTVANTFSYTQMSNITTTLSTDNIRNVIHVLYGSSSSQRFMVEQKDTTSISTYGRRFMESAQELTSNIDTSAEAAAMALGILDDLKDPLVDLSANVPFFPNAELQDYYTFTGDNVIFSTISLGVVSIKHVVSSEKSYTTLSCRGLPSSRMNWTQGQNVALMRALGYANQLVFSGGGSNLFANGNVGQFSKF